MKRILLILTLLLSFSASLRASQGHSGNGLEEEISDKLEKTEEATEEEKPNLKEIIFETAMAGRYLSTITSVSRSL